MILKFDNEEERERIKNKLVLKGFTVYEMNDEDGYLLNVKPREIDKTLPGEKDA